MPQLKLLHYNMDRDAHQNREARYARSGAIFARLSKTYLPSQ